MAQESILLTGATGNVGAVTLDQLLTTTSHTVTAVLRKSSYIPLLEKKYPNDVANKRLSFTVIPDMTVAGAFDAAASSSTAIMHIATPLAFGNWVNEMIKPTWEIDHNVLEAAKKSTTVKRVIICGTILQTMSFSDLRRSDLVINEESWNSTTFDEAKDGPFQNAYPYAKTNAEKETWAWMKRNESNIAFDVVMLLPSSILGRSPQVNFKPGDGPGGIPQTSTALLVAKTAEAIDGHYPFVVDTDDVAHRHILSLDRDKIAGNQRYLVTRAEPFNLRVVATRLRKEYPELAARLPDLPEDVDVAVKEKKLCKIDLTKSDAAFGTQWRDVYGSVAQIVLDVGKWEQAGSAM